MSGDAENRPSPLRPRRRVAEALGVSGRHVDRLVERGVLAPPVNQAGRWLWHADDVERARQARLGQRPSNRRHARKGTYMARRVREERAVVARVFLALLEHGEPGLQIACGIFRAHAPLGLRGLTVDQLARLVGQLAAADRSIRGLG
jgi:hypothetical protein